MNYLDAVDNLSPDIIERLRQAVETGRWPDGRPLTAQQRDHSLQAVIAWESKHLPPDARVGYIDKGRKDSSRKAETGETPAPLRWADNGETDA